MAQRKIPAKFFDKELGWLLFNERVLELAESPEIPVLERLNFHNIFNSNLDEFFMKRVGKLRALIKRIEGRDPERTRVTRNYIQSLLAKVQSLKKRSVENLREGLIPLLEKHQIFFTTPDTLSSSEKLWLRANYEAKIFPLLTPLVVDPGHPFPLISNLSHSLGFIVRRPKRSQRYFVRVKIPPSVPLWIQVPNTQRKHIFVNLLDVVETYKEEILPQVELDAAFHFRVIRSLETHKKEEVEEAEDLLELMAEEIRARKYSEIVRFEFSGVMHPWARQFLQRELDIKSEDFSQYEMPLPFKKIDAPVGLKLARLKYRPFPPAVPNALVVEPDIFKAIARSDILLHHPFESFSDSVEAFLAQAANDPQVLSIKMTLYRAGNQSRIIEALTRAALNGKSVVCLVELKARLDEERNIQWAKKLEASGVHVIYGVLDLKTHAKTTVVVRKEGEVLKTYAHVGTGNYNAHTAKLYTDLGLLTSETTLAKELIKGFNYLTGMAGRSEFKQILVSPLNLKQKLLELIDKEGLLTQQGKPGRIIIKVNSLDDVDIVKALYRASQSGVKVDLIVRGVSTLIPQVPKLSENIRVISVLGRLLEHSRIYFFGDGRRDLAQGKCFIGSSDAMRRSFQERVELLVPVRDPAARADLKEYFSLLTDPRCQRWEMQSDGSYLRYSGKDFFDSQSLLVEKYT